MKLRPFHHQRPLVAFALAFGAGVWAGVSFAWRPWPAVLGALLAVLAVFLLRRMEKRRIGGVLCLALCLGYLLSGMASHPYLPPEGDYRVTGIAAQDMTIREDGKAAGYLEQVIIEGDGGRHSLGRIYWTYLPEEEMLFLPLEGQQVSFSGYVYHPSGRTNPYGLDFRLFLLQKGVAVGVSGAEEGVITGSPSRGLASLFYQAQKALSRQIQLIFGEGSALPEALLVGVRENLPDETVQKFSDAGVAHILSISGLHVAMLAGAVMLLLRSFLSPGKRFAVLSVFLLCYCALLGFSAPVVRASLLMLIAYFRMLVRRSPDPLTSLAAAFLLILIVRPLDLFSGSFQLSFAAVLGLVLFQEQLSKRFLAQEKKGAGLIKSMITTFSATVGVAIPTIQLFHRLSVVGLLLNPLVCLVFEILLPLYALVLLVGCISLPVGTFLAAPLNMLSGGLIKGIEWLGDLPFAAIPLPTLPFYVVAALAGSIFLLSRYVTWPMKRKWLCSLLACAAAFSLWAGTACRDVQYIQLHMGQADSALILDGKETWVIDAGEHGGDLSSYLQATGRKADRLILTHLHTDHCQGVLQLLEDDIFIGEVYLPEGAEDQELSDAARTVMAEIRAREIPVYFLSAGDELTVGRVSCRVLWPVSGTVKAGMEANRYSLAALWEMEGVRLLTMSDVPGTFENYAAADADIIKIAHHGSKNSTGLAFLSQVTPQMALVTSDAGSRYFPHPETSERLAQMGVSVYNTGEWGAVTLTISDGQASVTTFFKEGSGL